MLNVKSSFWSIQGAMDGIGNLRCKWEKVKTR